MHMSVLPLGMLDTVAAEILTLVVVTIIEHTHIEVASVVQPAIVVALQNVQRLRIWAVDAKTLHRRHVTSFIRTHAESPMHKIGTLTATSRQVQSTI